MDVPPLRATPRYFNPGGEQIEGLVQASVGVGAPATS